MREPGDADNLSMPKRSIRDLWGKLTEKKAMKPEVRDMLLSLDGVYEPRARPDASKTAPDRPTQTKEEG